MKLSFIKLLNILLEGKNVKIFFFLTIMSMAFSTSVILCTLGIMDGYEEILKKGLRKNSSDLEIVNDFGFFEMDDSFKRLIDQHHISDYTGIIRTEGFVIGDNVSKGVLINGVKTNEFHRVSPLKINLRDEGSIVLGSVLAEQLGVKVGEGVTLAFTRGNQNFESHPYIKRLTVSDIVKHGVHRKDARIVYLDRDYLERFTNARGKVNTCLIKVESLNNDEIELLATKLTQEFSGEGYEVKPYWNDFARLLEAVQVEKFSITIILQLIVIIALFNIVAFINFSSIKKSQEFFLLRALGLSFKGLYSFWVYFILLIWLLSSLVSLVMVEFFDLVILRLPFLKIPGSIYELDHLGLSLSFKSISAVFITTLIWCICVILLIVYREKGKSLVQGLKRGYV